MSIQFQISIVGGPSQVFAVNELDRSLSNQKNLLTFFAEKFFIFHLNILYHNILSDLTIHRQIDILHYTLLHQATSRIYSTRHQPPHIADNMSASPEPSRDESLVSKAPESDPRDDEVNNQLLNGYQVLDSVRIPIPRSSYLRQLEKAARNSTRTSSTTPEPEPEKKIAKTRKKMVGRRPARNKKKSKIEISVPLNQNVPYQVYACDWDGCQAELHNLTMLRKHVLKVHFSGPADDGDSGGGGVEMMRLSCKWEACSYSDASSRPELYTHVLNKHIEPLAWKLGDGPFVPWIGEMPFFIRCRFNTHD